MGDREGKPVVFKAQTPATKEKEVIVLELDATRKVVADLPQILIGLKVHPSVASFIEKDEDVVVGFAIKKDRSGFSTWLDSQTGFNQQVRSGVLLFFDKYSEGVLAARFEAYKAGMEAIDAQIERNDPLALQKLKESKKHQDEAAAGGAPLSDNKLLESDAEYGEQREKGWKEKHARDFLKMALKVGYDKDAVLALSKEWNIRPPLEVQVPGLQLGGPDVETPFLMSARQAIMDLLSMLKDISDRKLNEALGRKTYSKEELGAAEGALEGSKLEVAIEKRAKEQGLDNDALIAKSVKLLATLCEQKGLSPAVAVVVISSTKISTNTFLDIAMRI